MALLSKDLGIDLGTINVFITERGEVLLHEPSVVAISLSEERIVAVGQEARDMMGKVPENIAVTRPLREGVIADYAITERMLYYFLQKVAGPIRLFKPRVMITAPYGATSVESRAVHEAAVQAGSREAYLIHEPLAAAIGAGLPVSTPTGNMVVVLGGGVSQAGVAAMNGLVSASAIRIAGLKLDESISTYVRKKYGLAIGDTTAEEVKIRIGAAVPQEEELTMEVQGRDQVTGLPRSITLSTGEIVEALKEPLGAIVAMVRGMLEKTPPELSSDIIDRGIALCGGGAQLRGIDRLVTRETGVPAFVADNPVACAALGAEKALQNLEMMRRTLVSV